MHGEISIHTLRVEGDPTNTVPVAVTAISIHTLRVEGDSRVMYKADKPRTISIHTLRVEGDTGKISPRIF